MCTLVATALPVWLCLQGLQLFPKPASLPHLTAVQSPAPKDQLVFPLPLCQRGPALPLGTSMALYCVYSADLTAGPGSEGHGFLIPWQRIGQGGCGWDRNTFAPASPALVLRSHPMQMHPSPSLLFGPGSQPHLSGHEPIPHSEADRWRLSLN